ncbi:MAG: hypothetical protein KDA45_09020 [Planctomycetales bacterium]|nr:hypothetical protein [Planctomycetales bacterium]
MSDSAAASAQLPASGLSSTVQTTEPANSGLAFLEDLAARHSYVLDELEGLNARIEEVLTSYSKSRQAAGNADSAAGSPAAAP